jgi:Ca-activated chloride channel homolog
VRGFDLFRRFVPPPRRAFAWPQTIPIILFLLLFITTSFGLERQDVLLFARPSALWLILISVWFWWLYLAGHSGLSRVRSMLALCLRLVIVGGFVMLLAEPHAVRTRDIVSVVYTLDVSDSIGEDQIDQGLEFVARHNLEKPLKDEAGLVVFGGTAAVEHPPRTTLAMEPVVASRVVKDATNIEQALSLAAAMLPAENRGRIVLMSDGTSTGGNLSQLLDELKSREISVDVLPVSYQYDREVWIERLDLPQYVKLGQDYAGTVIVSSLQPGEGKLVLRENGEVIAESAIEFTAGKNQFSVPIRLRTPGYYEYLATLELPSGTDHLRQNNSVLNFLYVEGEGKVLVVGLDPDREPQATAPLVEALRASERATDVISAIDFPAAAMSLSPYDCIIWVNVPSDAFEQRQLQALHDAVRDLGIGFLMVGGPNSFGKGGYNKTLVERVLPVSMDVSKKKVLPKGALVIVLHTCEFPEGNTWGKRIAKEAINVLSDQDDVGVLIYDSRERWLFELAPASQRDEMAVKINGAEIGDMPTFATTMELALAGLQKSDASSRHMIIISDGDPTPAPPGLLQSFADQQISVSTVAVFPHGGRDVGVLSNIAGVTRGRYYFCDDPAKLPQIFIKEARTLKRNLIVQRDFVPERVVPTQILEGIDTAQLLKGYVLTSLKPDAELLLQTPLGEAPEEGEEHDPILARGRAGLGSTAAFTSDLSSHWAGEWVKSPSFQPFIKQLVTDISRVRKPGSLRLWTYASGGDAIVMVEDFGETESFLEIAARVAGPGDQSESLQLRQVSPRRYQARLPLWGQGRYQVIVQGSGSGRDELLTGGFIVPYSPEYLRFRSMPTVLNEIREKTGGQWLDPNSRADVVYGRREPKQSSKPIFDWFLIGLAIAIPVDVACRRIQIDWFTIKSLLGRDTVHTGPANATMGTLLQRKQDVGAKLASARETAARQNAPPPSLLTPVADSRRERMKTPPPVKPSPTSQSPSSSKSGKTESGSTMERLLAQKRKRQEEQDETAD